MSKIMRQVEAEGRAAREAKRVADEAATPAPAPDYDPMIWVPGHGAIPTPVADSGVLGGTIQGGAGIPAPGEAPWWLRPATADGAAQQQVQKQYPWPFPLHDDNMCAHQRSLNHACTVCRRVSRA